MGQSTTHPGRPRPPGEGQNVAESFGELLTPLGDWFIDQFVFVGSNVAPVHITGRATSRSLIGRAAIIAMFELPPTGARFAALVTFNPRTNQYEAALVDANSDMGLAVMVSESLNERAPLDVRVRFGKSATVIRSWSVAQTEASLSGTMTDVILALAPLAAAEAGILESTPAAGVSIRLVEILVGPDRWLLQLFLTGPNGEVLVWELVCSRIQPGCQPQLGCELGCAGIPGCAAGCEGFQPTNGVPLGQAPMTQAQIMSQAQVTGQPQCGCATQPGQVLTGCQTQLIGVPQLGCAQPVVLAPQVCAPLACAPQVCAPQACPRPRVPAPRRMGPQRPGHPGHPGHGGHK